MTTTAPRTVELDVGGMTCASCAARIERKLGKLDGVTATVNYATEQAHVEYPDGMPLQDLIDVVEKTGYTAAVAAPEEPAETDEGRDRLGARLTIAAAASVPVVVVSMIPSLQFDYWQWIAFALTTVVVFWCGYPFHRAAAVTARHGMATMDTLVSLGTLAAYGWSTWALVFGTAGRIGMTHAFTFRPGAHDPSGQIYLEVAAGVTTFLLAGRYAESRAKRRSGAALRALLEVGAKDVSVLRDGVEQRIPVSALRVGDEFVVRPGEKIATDGQVVRGRAAVDTSMLTGESVPVEVGEGDTVVGGTLDNDGLLTVRADRVGSDTRLAHIAKLVTEAQSGKAHAQRLADRVSAVFVPVVLTVAAATLTVWLLLGHQATEAFTAAVAVLIVACPCALGLATPTALLVGTGRGAQMGIIVKGPEVLEQTRRIETVVLDKTGTVTTGRMEFEDVIAARGGGSGQGAGAGRRCRIRVGASGRAGDRARGAGTADRHRIREPPRCRRRGCRRRSRRPCRTCPGRRSRGGAEPAARRPDIGDRVVGRPGTGRAGGRRRRQAHQRRGDPRDPRSRDDTGPVDRRQRGRRDRRRA